MVRTEHESATTAGFIGAAPNVLLLGPLRVVTTDGAQSVTGHAGRLLVELIVSGPVVSRERLADVLWSDHPPASADAALRMHLSRLRRLLESTPAALERSGSSLELVGAATDIDHYEASVRLAREVRSGEATWAQLDEGAAALATSAGLWRGQPFAPYDDDSELAGSINRVQTLRAEAEDLAFDIDLDRGRHGALVVDLERAVADEPFREGAWARLMVALYRDGRQRDALAAYSSARALLVEQLGVEPGPELRRVHALILAQDPDLDWTAPANAPAPSPVVGGDRSDALIGRDKEFAAVVAALGEHRLVTVCGPPGIGKSALVAAVVESAVPDPVVVDLERVASAALLPVGLADALGLQPDPSDGIDPLPLARAALEGSDVIVVLDGGDRLGAAVADLATDLLACCPRLRILTARRSTLDLDLEVAIDLPLLEPVDAIALLVQLLDATPGVEPAAHEASLDRVAAATDGHPLSLQLAAGWISLLGADLVAEELESGELPIATDPQEPFVDRVEVSLRSVDPRAAAAFVVLAAFEAGFDFEAVAAVAGLSPRDAARVVRDLRRAALIQPDGAPGRWYLLTAIRDAAWELADRDGRRDAIVAAHEAFLLDVLAPWHRESFGFDAPGVVRALAPWRADLHDLYARRVAAGDLDGVAELIDGLYWYWDAAGLRQEAEQLLAQALVLGEANPDHPQLGFIRSLHSSIGATFGWQADHLDEAELALSESERHDHRLGIFSAHLGLAMGHGWKGDLVRAEHHLEAARAAVDAAPRYFGPSPDSYLGVVRLAAGDHVDATRLLEKAIDAYDEIGSPWGAAHCLTFLGMVAVSQGDQARAECVFRQTIEKAVESGKRHSELHARMELADLLAQRGSEDDALVEYELVTAELLDLGDLGCAGQCLCGWAEVARALGEIEPARWLLVEAAGVGRRGRDSGVLVRAVTGLAEIALDRGDGEEAAALVCGLDAVGDLGGRPVRPGDQARRARCVERVRASESDQSPPPGPGGPGGSPNPVPVGPDVVRRSLSTVLAAIRTDAARSGHPVAIVRSAFT